VQCDSHNQPPEFNQQEPQQERKDTAFSEALDSQPGSDTDLTEAQTEVNIEEKSKAKKKHNHHHNKKHQHSHEHSQGAGKKHKHQVLLSPNFRRILDELLIGVSNGGDYLLVSK